MAMQYGKTWWGEKWLNAFNNIDFSNRLPRGRSYANRGSDSDIKIVENTVTARVQGSQRTPYKVKIDIQPFSSDIIKNIHEIINQSPTILAQLINRQLPNSLFTKLIDKNIHLFPSTWSDLKASCSCPDWAVPCKHIAAIIYLIAAEIDKNPFIIFSLHNCYLEDIIESSQKNSIQEIRTIPRFSKIITTPCNIKNNDIHADFSTIDFSKIPDLADQINMLLTKDPLFYVKDFRDIMNQVYKHWKRSPTQLNIKQLSEQSFMDQWGKKIATWSDIRLVINDSQQCIEIQNGSKVSITMLELISILDQLPSFCIDRLCPSVKLFHFMYHYTLKLIQSAALIPHIMMNDSDHYFIRWVPALFDPVVCDIYEKLCALCEQDVVVYKNNTKISIEKTQQLIIVISTIASALTSNNLPSTINKNSTQDIFALFFNGKVQTFKDFNTKEIPQTIALWLERLYLSEKSHAIYLFIDDMDDIFFMKIKIELARNKITKLVDLSEIMSNRDHNTRLTILADLMLLCDYIPQLETLIDSSQYDRLSFAPKDFAALCLHTLPILNFLGIKVILPKSLQKMVNPNPILQLSSVDKLYKNSKTFLGLDELLQFDWKVAIGNHHIDIHEFKKKLQESGGIVKMFDQYVIFDDQKMALFLKKFENLPDRLNNIDLMQASLSGEFMDFQVSCDDHVEKLFNTLTHYRSVDVPHNLYAALRPYQAKGFNWLIQNIEMGFGSILADDMGLGKTLQVIASILYLKNNGFLDKEKVLVVAPTSLLSNWQKEIARFAPVLKSVLYHGNKRALSDDEYDVMITSYGLARRDKTVLNKKSWFLLVIDEAQNIKNCATEQTKAIKSIRANHKIAMSGTPVENRLLEYWSIFDFTNKNYLGTVKSFNKNFAIPIEKERDRSCLSIFNKITSPFILRRHKSDKSIISDLPEKIENNRYCNLTVEQAALYEQVTKMTLKKIECSEGIQRKGIIFQLLNALKQICNHPMQYAKKKIADIDSSGKMQMLIEILATIDDLNEKSIIFTQYVEMGELLVNMIGKRMGITVPFLHGGLSIKQRDMMVHDFQNLPQVRVMIISLKAGGTGLNLTAANHVIHYDLWWNPAVEAQATDRAYRIGQQKNVMVHRLITSETFEERIDEMIQQKKELANLTVESGEQWITELTNEQLHDLVSLRKREILSTD